jgi:A/G-specific adenine glycosylase
VLRESDGPVPAALLDAAWADESQRARSLASLVADGLAEPLPGGSYALPR